MLTCYGVTKNYGKHVNSAWVQSIKTSKSLQMLFSCISRNMSHRNYSITMVVMLRNIMPIVFLLHKFCNYIYYKQTSNLQYHSSICYSAPCGFLQIVLKKTSPNPSTYNGAMLKLFDDLLSPLIEPQLQDIEDVSVK